MSPANTVISSKSMFLSIQISIYLHPHIGQYLPDNHFLADIQVLLQSLVDTDKAKFDLLV